MDDFKKYGESANGNYRVKDSIGVPHPYMIGARHVGHAADNFGGRLGKEAIESAEEQGIKCCVCKGELSYAEHEQALLVESDKDHKGHETLQAELQTWLKSICDMATSDGYAGFAFLEPKA